MCEATLEALVRHLKTFTLLQGTRPATFDVRLQAKPSERREKPAFRRREEEKGQTQPQFYGTQYFSVRIALTGLHPDGDLLTCQSIFPKEPPVSESHIAMFVEIPCKLGGIQL